MIKERIAVNPFLKVYIEPKNNGFKLMISGCRKSIIIQDIQSLEYYLNVTIILDRLWTASLVEWLDSIPALGKVLLGF